MKKQVLTAVSGSALAAALLLAPSAATATPQKVSAACGYQTSLATATQVSAAKPMMRQREQNTVTVHVTSGSGNPSGTVTVKVGSRAPVSKGLSKGYARFPVPTNLAPNRTYT